ncbi:MAG: hypothetical protein Q9174_006495, partial [Haloplaca sp. 1 TL-2023]
MAKESLKPAEAEEKRIKKEKKAEKKRSESEGVHKSKKDKSSKKEKKDRSEKKDKKRTVAPEEEGESGQNEDSISQLAKPPTTKDAPIADEAEDVDMTTQLLNSLEETKPGSVVLKEGGDIEVKVKTKPLLGALVPFANPLADEKTGKKVLKGVKK